MRSTFFLLVALGGLLIGAGACGDEEGCTAGEQKCSEMQIQTCGEDGDWGEAQACPDGQHCMAMDNAMEHCMGM